MSEVLRTMVYGLYFEKDSFQLKQTFIFIPDREKRCFRFHFSGAPRAPNTIAKKILVTYRCEKIWFYGHDVIDRPRVRQSVRLPVRPFARSCKSNVKRRTVTSLQAQS